MPRVSKAVDSAAVRSSRIDPPSRSTAKKFEYDIQTDLQWISERCTDEQKCYIYEAIEEITKAGIFHSLSGETPVIFSKLLGSIKKILHG